MDSTRGELHLGQCPLPMLCITEQDETCRKEGASFPLNIKKNVQVTATAVGLASAVGQWFSTFLVLRPSNIVSFSCCGDPSRKIFSVATS